MSGELLLWALVLIPLAGTLLVRLPASPAAILRVMVVVVAASSLLGAYVAWLVFTAGPLLSAGGWLFSDGLSAYNLLVLDLIFTLSSFYAIVYFTKDIESGSLSRHRICLFASLWCGAMAAMTVVLVSNNLGIMWVGMEATTLLTAFLICIHRTRASLEAMWKYLLICSIGVALAFMGTLLVAASASHLHFDSVHAMLWTTLRDNAAHLDPVLVKIAFVFLVVGYGTKAGLAPMHTWLPDAHSQAPTPVSAVFSGFMLNTALYCIMRYVPIIETATGNNGWGLGILTMFGLVSIVVAAAFILFQHDLKRLLAYHSVEHIGIITLGIGLGGIGTFAALFHTLNHSLCKTLAFFAAGRLGQIHGTHDMRIMKGTLTTAPLWGTAIFGSLLALIGVAPFALFMSEFQIVKAALDTRAIFELVVFLSGAAVVFVGALGHAIPLVWAAPTTILPRYRANRIEVILVVLPLGILLMLGLWMPDALQNMLNSAADVIHNRNIIGPVLWGESAL